MKPAMWTKQASLWGGLLIDLLEDVVALYSERVPALGQRVVGRADLDLNIDDIEANLV